MTSGNFLTLGQSENKESTRIGADRNYSYDRLFYECTHKDFRADNRLKSSLGKEAMRLRLSRKSASAVKLYRLPFSRFHNRLLPKFLETNNSNVKHANTNHHALNFFSFALNFVVRIFISRASLIDGYSQELHTGAIRKNSGRKLGDLVVAKVQVLQRLGLGQPGAVHRTDLVLRTGVSLASISSRH